MNFLYRLCAKITYNYHESIKFQIESQTSRLNHARYCSDICRKARSIASTYRGLNAPPPKTTFTPEEIDILIQFVNLKEVGESVDWENTVKEYQMWFYQNGIPVPEREIKE